MGQYPGLSLLWNTDVIHARQGARFGVDSDVETIWLIHFVLCELTCRGGATTGMCLVHDEASIVSEQLIGELKGLIEGGQIEEAREFLRGCSELVEDEKSLFHAGLLFLWADCPAQALEFAQLGKERFPGKLRFSGLLGMTLTRLERYQEARVEVEAACVERVPRILTDFITSIYLALEDLRAGERLHTKSMEDDPDCPERRNAYVSFLHDFAFILLKKYNNSDDALALFRKAETLAPTDGDVQFGLGCTYYTLDQLERAIPHLQKATHWPHCWGLLTGIYDDLDEFQKALETSRKAIEHFPSRVDMHLIRARAARHLELRDEELEALQQAIRLSPDNREIKTDLALYYYKSGDRQLALDFVDEAIAQGFEEKTDECVAFWTRGMIKVALDDDEAIKDYDHALSLEPELLPLYLDKAEAQYWLGWPEDALDTLDQALSIDPGDERAFGILTKVTCHLARLSEE